MPASIEMPDASGVPAGSRPRLLFLCQTLPFPPDGGAAIRSFNVLKLLAQTYDITAVCFWRRGYNQSQVDAAVAALGKYAAVEAFPIGQDLSRLRKLTDHARSLLTGTVYTRYVHASRAATARIQALLAYERFDLVHVDSLDLSAFLPLFEGRPTICVHHNVESALLRRRAMAETSLARRLYVAHQARLMEREEKRWCASVALNVVVSREDGELLQAIVPDARIAVVPNGVDTDAFVPVGPDNDGIAFAGGMGWFPNRDALDYFCNSILPELRRLSNERFRVNWVGRVDSAVQHEYSDRFGITLTGYVDDIRPVIGSAACYVVPLRVGGGTRLKILDAWAMGKAIVSTSVGCEGLEARDGDNILIRDDPASFAEAVRAVMDDPDLRGRLGGNARATAVAVYSWVVIGRAMISEYEAVRGDAASERRPRVD